MNNNKLGIIGGMGPLATKVFYDRIIKTTVASKDQDHIDMIILNHATMPDRTKAIMENTEHFFLEAVKKDIELLEHAGVENIAIPCNTSHYFYNEMQAMTRVNIINMLEETAQFVYGKFGEQCNVGILATDGTISTNIYKTAFKNTGINPDYPNPEIQEKVMKIIYDIKADVNYDPAQLEYIIMDFIKNESLQCVVLGCTELSSVTLNNEINQYCVDPLNILVNQSIKLSGKKQKVES